VAGGGEGGSVKVKWAVYEWSKESLNRLKRFDIGESGRSCLWEVECERV
jgi:hypothetical protein